MKACIVSIGDELLIGQTINTNAAWMGEQLNTIGIQVVRAMAIADDENEIISSLDQASAMADLILITGGLGPTKDDITKHTLCKYFETTLRMDDELANKLRAYFEQRGRAILESNLRQAEIPIGCKVIHNSNGTAPGMWFEKNGKHFISMPGVPYEMKGIMEETVLPELNLINESTIVQRTILTTGIGESFLAEKIQVIESELREQGLGLAYLPSPGLVKLRITAKGKSKSESQLQVNNFAQRVKDAIGEYYFGEGTQTLESIVGEHLRKNNWTLGAVESCTGGRVGQTVISVPGASEYFNGTIVAYAYSIKEKVVGLDHDTLLKHGAVSEWCAMELAEKGRKLLGTDFCISTTGIAGPGGGTETKPVGTVWIGFASNDKVFAKKFIFGNNRERNIQMSVAAALNLLRLEIS